MDYKRYILFFLILISHLTDAAGQSTLLRSKIDSVEKVIQNLPGEVEKVNALLFLAEQQQGLSNYSEASLILEAAKELAKNLTYNEGLAQACLQSSQVLLKMRDFVAAHEEAEQAKSLYQQQDSALGISKALYQIGEIYATQSFHNQAILFYDSTLQISLKHGNQELAGKALLSLSAQYNYKGLSELGREYAHKAKGYFEKTNNSYGLSMAYNNLGEADRRQSKYTEALKNYHYALKIAESNNLKNSGIILNGVGLIYIEQKEFEKAIKIYQELITVNKKANDNIGLALNYNNLGLSYAGLGQHKEAILSYNKGLSIEKGNKRADMILYFNIGESYMILNENHLALKFYYISYDFAKETDNKEAIAYCYNGLGLTYYQLKAYETAEDFLQKGRDLAVAHGLKELIMENYQKMVKLDSARGNYPDAMAWQKKFFMLKDSLNDELRNKQISEIEARYKSEKKDKEILKLTRSQEVAAINQANERTLFLLTVSFLIILAVILIYAIFKRRKTNILLKAQKEEIGEKNEELKHINEEIKSVLETVEEQNKMLHTKNIKLEELHEEKDGLIGIVAHDLRSPISKAMGLAELIKNAGPTTDKQNEFIELQKKVCREGTNLIQDLLMINMAENKSTTAKNDPIEINKFIRDLAENYSRMAEQKQVNFQLINELPANFYINSDRDYITRILDNLVSNAIKFTYPYHAVYLNIKQENDYIVFIVKDEGQGLSDEDKKNLFKKFKRLSAKPTGGESSTGLGLSIVKTLLKKLDGTIEVESEQRKGTTFTIYIPTKGAEQHKKIA